MQYSLNNIRAVLDQKGYAFFDAGPYDMNIIGIRSNESKSNSFDDMLYLIYKDESYQWHIRHYPITTDPGKPWLLNPLPGTGGTAILVPDQYRKAYKIGIHGRSHASGGYVALEQIKPMRYVRDRNRDSVIDFKLYEDTKNIFVANIKTNIHRASKWAVARWVEVHSAGCQVFQNPAHFDQFLDLCKKQVKHGMGETFTYTLLEQRDFA